jgi:hypothetical protein
MRIVTALFCALAATAVVASAVVPAQSQTPPQSSAAKKKQAGQDPVASRPPTRVVVRRRSFLDPGTETKTRQEHFLDYAFPPGDHYIGTDQNDFRLNWTRMPFPSCLDLAGFCGP